MKIIELTQGFKAIVDDTDYEELSKYKWHYSNGYAVRKIQVVSQNKSLGIKSKQKIIHMHRVINKTADGFDTDHVDGNKLNNCKCNLRNATTSQNGCNRKLSKSNTSGFKGATFNRLAGKFKAEIKFEQKYIYLGLFDTALEAAVAYDNKAIELFGIFAKTNRSMNLVGG